MAKQIKLRRQQKQKKQMEQAALELQKQLEKIAEKERQQAALFRYLPLSHMANSGHPSTSFWPTPPHTHDCPWPGKVSAEESKP